MIQEQLKEIIYQIKRYQNGAVSTDMQEKTGSALLNFGLTLPIMRDIALQYRDNNQLAMLLWEKNVRECKIIATLIANPKDFDVTFWINNRIDFEICDQIAFNQLSKKVYSLRLLQKLMGCGDEYSNCIAVSGISIMVIKNKIPIDQYPILKEMVVSLNPKSEILKIKILNCLENLNHKWV